MSASPPPAAATLGAPGTVAVVDGRMDGHHTSYLRLVTKMFLDLGARVLLLCPEPMAVERWLAAQTGDQGFTDRLAAAPFRLPQPRRPPKTRVAGLTAYLRRWNVAARAIQRHGHGAVWEPRLVLFLWLDDFLSSARYISLLSPLLLPLVFRHPWAGIFFRPTHLRAIPGRPPVAPSRHLYSALRSSSCRRVFIPDEAGVAALGRGPTAAKARRFPDFTDESAPDNGFALIDELRARARGRTIVSALGSMSKRKGILTLLEVAMSSGDQPWFFLFAGEPVRHHFSAAEFARLRELGDRPPENCCFYLRYIPDEPSFNALVAASDVVFAAYRDFYHTSNILTKAAMFRNPVIVSRGYNMEENVRRFKLGVCIAQDSVAECAAAIRLLSDPTRFRREVGEPRFDDYFRINSLTNCKVELAELLGEQA